MKESENVDWSYRGLYTERKHGVSIDEASCALADPAVLLLDPDPAGIIGETVRLVGFCERTVRVITVILLPTHRGLIGVNGWPSHATDRKRYARQAADH